MICYRRRGHNEGDEPSYTQPLMYKLIDQMRSVRKLYMERLVNTGDISVEDGEALLQEFHEFLDRAFAETKEMVPAAFEPIQGRPAGWSPPRYRSRSSKRSSSGLHPAGGLHRPPQAGQDARRAAKDARVGDDRLGDGRDPGDRFDRRRGPLGPSRRGGLAAGDLQPPPRRTHRLRHRGGVDPAAERPRRVPRVRIVDSLLSEFAAVGFEYGYSVEWHEAFVVWEAQFGDFGNGAQVMIDQFIAAGEAKWGQRSALVMLLPHGYEGQGPEHSSGRIERFLQLCADNNMRIVIPSTSGSYFHTLRRQVSGTLRRPMVMFTPKSLLRTKETFSTVEELTGGGFRKVLGDPHAAETPGCAGWCCAAGRSTTTWSGAAASCRRRGWR